jgi:cytochrome c oxidase assembly protein subunit 11
MSANAGLRDDNRQLLVKLSVVAACMFAFGYALVPFYEKICEALGVNNLAGEVATPVNTQVDATRTVVIELDGNTHEMPWRFRPLVNHVDVHPGQVMTVEYEVSNVRGEPITGQAVPSYGPRNAAQYFRKLDCFCFKQQTLAAGETRRMPVTFIVDPALPKDVGTITVSYTFFEVPGLKGKS